MESQTACIAKLPVAGSPPPNVDDLLTPEETAGLLGVKPDTLANWRCTKRVQLPYLKLGARIIRYRRSDVADFLQCCMVHPAAKAA